MSSDKPSGNATTSLQQKRPPTTVQNQAPSPQAVSASPAGNYGNAAVYNPGVPNMMMSTGTEAAYGYDYSPLVGPATGGYDGVGYGGRPATHQNRICIAIMLTICIIMFTAVIGFIILVGMMN